MIQKIKTLGVAIVLAAASTSLNAQQLKVPAPSPLQTVKQAFALSDITVEYSRPSAKGRTIYGDLVPYGKIWRTGANGATKITFGEDVKFEGTAIVAGTYALYTIPNKDSWEVMLYKDLSLGGDVANYKSENEVAHVKVSAKKMNDKTETFTIDLSDISATSTNVTIKWENTAVAINVVADIDAKIMKNIESTVINDNRPYFQAASYYYDNNKDLAKAAEWIDKGISSNPKAFWMVMLKAKIQAKQKDTKGAVASAEQVIALAKEAKNDDYVKQAEKFIVDNKK